MIQIKLTDQEYGWLRGELQQIVNRKESAMWTEHSQNIINKMSESSAMEYANKHELCRGSWTNIKFWPNKFRKIVRDIFIVLT